MERLDKIKYQAGKVFVKEGGLRIIFQFYKICNNRTPTYLLGNVPRQCRLLYGKI